MIVFQALTIVNFALCLYLIWNLNEVADIVNDVIDSVNNLWSKEEKRDESV